MSPKMRKIEKVAQRVFSALFSRPEAQTLVDYNRSEDVLYVNFVCGEPEAADFGRRFGDYIIRIKGRRVIGVTIINAIEHFDKHFAQMLDQSFFWDRYSRSHKKER